MGPVVWRARQIKRRRGGNGLGSDDGVQSDDDTRKRMAPMGGAASPARESGSMSARSGWAGLEGNVCAASRVGQSHSGKKKEKEWACAG